MKFSSKQKYYYFHFSLLLLVFSFFYLNGGFSSGTLVKVPHGYTQIEKLKPKDLVFCYNLVTNTQQIRPIIHIHKKISRNCIKIQLFNEAITVDSLQKFYLLSIKNWGTILLIKSKNLLQKTFPYLQKITIINQPTELYEITIADFHNFYVSKQDLLVHNYVATIIFTLCQSTIIPTITQIGCGILTGLGIAYYKKQPKKSHHYNTQEQSIPSNPSPKNPKDPKQNNFFENIKQTADKTARSIKFGKFYRDPYTKLWWSKDRAGHGGSAFKVFQENSKGLEWMCDADQLGNFILQKNKGPIGTFISYKDLIICS